MYFLYSLLLGIGGAVAFPFLLLKNFRTGKYKNWRERFGHVPPEISKIVQQAGERPIWVHAVSVGEALAAAPLVRALKQRFPERPLFISTTTMTGQTIAREKLNFADGTFYFPLDWAWCVRRALRAVRPEAVIVMETEIWPNFMRETRQANAKLIFANGRISDGSAARYERLLRRFGFVLRGFFRDVLSNADAFLMQTERDAERIRVLGAAPEKVSVSGNLKYDSPVAPNSELESWLREALAGQQRRPVIVAGSVTAHEEPLVLIAFGVFQGQYKNAFLILAPRKPERFDDAGNHIEESLRKYVRRSSLNLKSSADGFFPVGMDVLLLDSIGELASLYRLADGVFVGGSMVSAGGHNILEPAGLGKPPLFGESMENFRDVANSFLAAGAARQVENPEDLGVAWIELMQNPAKNADMGAKAKALVEANRGATQRTVEKIAAIVGSAHSGDAESETAMAGAREAHGGN
jgi:3-deoxy-D-manno-octulosonic-acid transferase